MPSAHKPGRDRHTEALLDDALRMTFPASDPIAPAVDTEPTRARKEKPREDLHPPQADSTGDAKHAGLRGVPAKR
jgi:hypothetical protein